MFGTIRRHQQWVWMPIVTVIIITFLYFFMPNGAGFSRAAPASKVALVNGKPPTINGQPITREEFNNAYRESYLGYFFRSSGKEWPDGTESTKESLEHDTVVRVFMLHKLKD